MESEALGLHTMAVKCGIDKLIADASLPFIVDWQQRHFVMEYALSFCYLSRIML